MDLVRSDIDLHEVQAVDLCEVIAVKLLGSGGVEERLSAKAKGLSQQIELILALFFGIFLLGESLRPVGLAGCLILLVSYSFGVWLSDRPSAAGQSDLNLVRKPRA